MTSRDELRAAGAERRRHATRGLRPDGAARAQAAGQARGLGIRVGDAHGADLTALEHVDRAPVGELRHRELDELGQRVLQVERLAEDDAGLRQEGERFLALAVLGEVEEGGNRRDDLAARVAHGLGAERDDAARAVGAHDLDLVGRRRLSCQRQVHELGVRSRDRTFRCAVSQQLLRALVREQQLARRGLGDDHAERQLPYERGQALALAVRLLVERAVVERERDAPRDLRGELPLILVGRCLRPPPEGQRAERSSAHEQRRREHGADPHAFHRDAMLRAPVGAVRQVCRSMRPSVACRCGSRRRRACRSRAGAGSARA